MARTENLTAMNLKIIDKIFFVQIDGQKNDIPTRLWYTRPYPRWYNINMFIPAAVNIFSGSSTTINHGAALHFITRHFPGAYVLESRPQGFIYKVDNEILSPMINVRKLIIQNAHKGIEYMFDPQLLPSLVCVYSLF
jgi:hypothetical protein